MLEHTYGVRIAASAEAGRKLVAAESYAAGDQIIQELPLALSMAPSAHVHLCMVCCNPLDVPASSTPPRDGGDLSGFSQHTCSAKCAATATEQGFNDWWKAVGPLYQYAVQQHPAAARHMLAVAGMLARSWVSDPDTYWAHVEQLCAATGKDVWSAADRDAHATEYALLRQGFAAALVAKGGKAEEVDGVFESTYNLEWYAAMRGLLRLNALSVPLQALSTPPPPSHPWPTLSQCHCLPVPPRPWPRRPPRQMTTWPSWAACPRRRWVRRPCVARPWWGALARQVRGARRQWPPGCSSRAAC